MKKNEQNHLYEFFILLLLKWSLETQVPFRLIYTLKDWDYSFQCTTDPVQLIKCSRHISTWDRNVLEASRYPTIKLRGQSNYTQLVCSHTSIMNCPHDL